MTRRTVRGEKGDTMTSEIEHLYRVEKFLESMSDLDSLLEVIMRECSAALDAASSSLALYDEAAGELYFFAVRGEDEEREFEHQLKSIRLKMGSGVVGWCAANREPVTINDAYADPRFDQNADRKTGFVTRSILAVPMIRGDRLIGVVEAVNKTDGGGFTRQDEKVLFVLAAQAALIIENARLHQEKVQHARLTAMGQGIAGAAHCIKNILNSIGGGEFVIQTGLRKQDLKKIETGWEVMRRNTRIMKDLVLDMLTYSKEREPELETADINDICQDIHNLMHDKAEARNVGMAMALDPDIGPVVLDPKGIYRCVLNLAANAVDACDKAEGRVTIATQKENDGNRVSIAISDNGCGICQKDREKLFNAFFSTKGSKGTGLGLAVTEKIISEHGGAIHVDSEPGTGTTFTIRLPTCR
jgi:signal transduction histidine kinase